MKLLHLARYAADTVLHQRIAGLAHSSIQQSVAHFDRPVLTPVNEFSVPATSLGRISHGQYGRRIIGLLRAVSKVKQLARDADAVYAYSNDMVYLAILAGLHKRVPVIAQIDDIRHVLTHGRFSGIARVVDRWAFRKVSLLSVTSSDYVSGYYNDILGIKSLNWLEIENKVSLDASFRPEPVLKTEGPIEIVYSGSLRCPVAASILAEVATRGKGKFRIHLHGVITKPVVPISGYEGAFERLLASPGVVHHGGYTLPQDYSRVFDSCDILWACYPYSPFGTGNWRWAKTVRYYQGLFFCKPIITSLGTSDSRRASALGISFEVNLADHERCVEGLLTITLEQIRERALRMRELPAASCAYTDEWIELREKLEQLVQQKRREGKLG